MASVLLGEQRQGQSAIRSSGGIPILDETFHFLVKADSANESRLTVLATPGLPVANVSVSSFGNAVCKAVTAVRREDQPKYWDVTATFSSEVDESQQKESESQDPQEWVPIYETKFERLQEIVTKDYNDDAIANSAGQPFENGLVRARFIPIWEFFQFEAASVSDETVIDRNEVINSVPFKGRAARTLLCTVMSSVVGFYYGRKRRLTRYSLRYDKRNWKHKRLDVGTVYKDGTKQKAYEDADGNVILGGLNGSGGKVAVGTKPSVLEFAMYPEVAFASFLRI
jgi:hypothetical protein